MELHGQPAVPVAAIVRRELSARPRRLAVSGGSRPCAGCLRAGGLNSRWKYCDAAWLPCAVSNLPRIVTAYGHVLVKSSLHCNITPAEALDSPPGILRKPPGGLRQLS